MRSNTIPFSLLALSVSLLISTENVGATTFAYTNSAPSYSSDTVSPLAPASIAAVVKTYDAPVVVLSWSQASDNVGVTRYNIYRNGTFLFSPSGVGLTYIDKTVEVGQTYTYSVQSGDGTGNNSVQSDTIKITVKDGAVSYPTAPYSSLQVEASGTLAQVSAYSNTSYSDQPAVVATPGSVALSSHNNQLRISWKNPIGKEFKSVRVIKKASTYPVSINDGSIICDGVGEVCIDKDVITGKTYYYGVYAVDTSYVSSKMVLVSGVPVEAVGVPVTTDVQVAAVKQISATTMLVSALTTNVSSGNSNISISRTLTIGSTGEDVFRLQKFLNAQGFVLATTGPGSPGNETDYFGKGTQKAIQAYQCQNKIVCDGDPSSTGYGLVGKMTRGSLNKE